MVVLSNSGEIMSKKVSVIIPCYNGEKVIDRSIESVFIQDCVL